MSCFVAEEKYREEAHTLERYYYKVLNKVCNLPIHTWPAWTMALIKLRGDPCPTIMR